MILTFRRVGTVAQTQVLVRDELGRTVAVVAVRFAGPILDARFQLAFQRQLVSATDRRWKREG